MAEKTRYKDVFRSKRQGPTQPKLGTTADIQPGDLVTFSLAGPWLDRFVKSIHGDYLLTFPIDSKFGPLDGSRKVWFKDCYEAVRPLNFDPHQPKPEEPTPEPTPKPEPKAEPTPTPPKAKPEPKAEPTPPKAKPKKPKAEPTPAPPSKRKKKKKKPPVGLMEFLDGGYKE